MHALKVDPVDEVIETPDVPEDDSPVVDRVYTVPEFELWWARSEELNSVLRRLPRDVVAAASMGNRRVQLIERWEDLETPDVDAEEVDEETFGVMSSWIRDAETLIHYIIYTRDTRGDVSPEARVTANDANEAETPPVPPQPVPQPSELQIIATTADAPGVSEDWHWPWVDGWDDPARRKQILNPKKKKKDKKSFKRTAATAALGAGAVYMFSRYLDE